jgi:hypothetical protein
LTGAEVCVGDELSVINPATGHKRWGTVSYSQRATVERMRLTTVSGLALSCSKTAPIGLSSGESVLAEFAQDNEIAVEINGVFSFEVVKEALDIGLGDVQHITCENDFFLAGDEVGFYMAHHNAKPPVN